VFTIIAMTIYSSAASLKIAERLGDKRGRMREEIDDSEFEKSAFQETLSSIGLRQIM
jgi:hypothetical protein